MAVTDPKLREELARQWLPMAVRLATDLSRRYYVHYEELFSAALLGLTQALNRYNGDKGAQFGTFAVIVMRSSIANYVKTLRSNKRTLFKQEYLDPTSRRFSKGDCYDLDEQENLNNKPSKTIDPAMSAALMDELIRVKSELRDFEWQILSYRYIYGLTLRETAFEIGVTQSRVAQIEEALIERLRERIGWKFHCQ